VCECERERQREKRKKRLLFFCGGQCGQRTLLDRTESQKKIRLEGVEGMGAQPFTQKLQPCNCGRSNIHSVPMGRDGSGRVKHLRGNGSAVSSTLEMESGSPLFKSSSTRAR